MPPSAIPASDGRGNAIHGFVLDRAWRVIELTEQEARAFATVGVSLDDKRFVMPAGLNRIADQLDRHGIEPVQLPYDQVGFWGGSVCCSTQALSRAP